MSLQFDARTALIAVDMQNDFADPAGSLYVQGAGDVLAALAPILDRAHRAGAVVVYTADWHPAVTPHFVAQGGVWPSHCVQDTWGALFVKGLARVSPAVFVHKGLDNADGYSAFSESGNSSRAGTDGPRLDRADTGLDAMLRVLGVKRVVVSGLATDYCVKETVLDAVRLQFKAEVVEEAVAAVNRRPKDGADALSEMARAGAGVVHAWAG